MNTFEKLKSFNAELIAVQNRVRDIIGNKHWLSDGEWKERVLRQVLARHVPETIALSTGFVASKDGLSSQIDIMFRDKSRPTLFKDDAFSIVTPEAVSGIIEVKTTLYDNKIDEELLKVANNIDLIRKDKRRSQGEGKIFSGLMYYNFTENDDQKALEYAKKLPEICDNSEKKIDVIALGSNHLIKYFGYNPGNGSENGYNSWRVYRINEMALGYFIVSTIEYTSLYSIIGNDELWYPREDKEFGFIGDIKSTFKGRVF